MYTLTLKLERYSELQASGKMSRSFAIVQLRSSRLITSFLKFPFHSTMHRRRLNEIMLEVRNLILC